MIDLPPNTITLRYRNKELVTNDPFLIAAKRKLAWQIVLLVGTSFTLGGMAWSDAPAWLVYALVALLTFNGWWISRDVFGLWLLSVVHMLELSHPKPRVETIRHAE